MEYGIMHIPSFDGTWEFVINAELSRRDVLTLLALAEAAIQAGRYNGHGVYLADGLSKDGNMCEWYLQLPTRHLFYKECGQVKRALRLELGQEEERCYRAVCSAIRK